jgi:nucleotide-binding universal stress UspA family protein
MEKFLVAVDSSPYIDKIFKYLARVLSGKTDLKLIFLHIQQPCLNFEELLGEDFDRDILIQKIEALKHDKKKCREELKKIEDRLKDKISTALASVGFNSELAAFDFVQETGDYAQIILQKAKDHNCSTIVVGKKGDSIISEYLIGSTAEKLARASKGFTVWLVD